MSVNIAVMLRESALCRPGHPVLRLGERTVTYAELDESASRVAGGLLAHGLRPGDRVGVQLPNRVEFLEAYFGVLTAGLVMVPFNPQLTAAEIAHLVADSGATAVITMTETAPAVAVAAPGVPAFTVGDTGTFDTLRQAEPAEIAASSGDDTAVIIYTSGTTGRPKGAELTHTQLLLNATIAGATFGVQRDDVSLAALPFFHIYGLSGLVNVAVRFGTTMSVVPRFDVTEVLDAMAAHRVSVFVGVPTMYHALLAAGTGGRDLSALRIASSGGASMPGALMDAFEAIFGIVILEGYGLSETASTAMVNPGAADRRIGSVGRPIWGVQARLVDRTGAVVGPGADAIGEIQVRGHIVMKGYHGNPAATAEAIRDGWFATGDLAYRDHDGFYYIVDRIKDMIIRGGYNVYPREIEEVLYAHPEIAEAAVIGRPDERLGEEIVAVVALRPNATVDGPAILGHCRERLAAYKCPREVRILPELPKSATGKLLKRELR